MNKGYLDFAYDLQGIFFAVDYHFKNIAWPVMFRIAKLSNIVDNGLAIWERMELRAIAKRLKTIQLDGR